MSQVAFLIVFLLAFGERKSISTLRANDLYVWHVAVSMSGTEVSPLSFALRGASESPFRFYWLLTPGGLARALELKPSPTVLAFRNGLSGAEFTPPLPWVQRLFEAYGFELGEDRGKVARKSRRGRRSIDYARLFT